MPGRSDRHAGMRCAHRQRGQSAVFVLLFLGILLVSLNYLYKQGRITSDKMEMQNAADAAAYGTSLIEARDLNFAAYMNRAIVANEVAIGQMVGLASWAFHLQSFAPFLRTWDNTVVGPATLGIASPAMQSIAGGFDAAGRGFISVLKPLARGVGLMLSYINMGYGWAQRIFHIVSGVMSATYMWSAIEDNAPPGTRLSEFGFAALLTHIAGHGTIPLPVPGGQFTKVFNPRTQVDLDVEDQEPEPEEPPDPAPSDFVDDLDVFEDNAVDDKEAYERLAALVRQSRDPFTKTRGWKLGLFTTQPVRAAIDACCGSFAFIDDNGALNIEFGDTFALDLGVAAAGIDWRVFFYFGINLARDGGSELRIVIPASRRYPAGGNFNWSSADTTNLEVFLGGGFDLTLWAEIFGSRFDILDFGAGIYLGDDEFTIALGASGREETHCRGIVDDNGDPVLDADGNQEEECETIEHDTPFSITTPFPTSAPFGAGFAEFGKRTDIDLRRLRDMRSAQFGGTVPREAYGGAPKRILAWDATGPTTPGIAYQSDLPDRMLTGYQGLPQYIDTTGNETSLLGFGGPHMLVSLVLDRQDYDIDRGDPAQTRNYPQMGGTGAGLADLRLNEQFAGAFARGGNGQLHVIARSEVYFQRPLDLSYFARVDGQEEHANAFNPYWNARLVETRYVDRVLALLAQGRQEDVSGLSDTIDLGLRTIEDGLRGLIPSW
jgi:hypothetical protein